MIFLRLQLVNWGVFEGHDFRLDAPIVDIVGENGTGKTTILDAFNVVLNLAEELFRGRSLGSFQRDPSIPSYIALTVKNPRRSGERRAFPQHDDVFTILTRINTEVRSVQQYLILDGDIDITKAIQEGNAKRTKWMLSSQYEEKWHMAGYRKTDRKNRMFGHKRPEKVRDSTPRQLYDLFETLTNNADHVAALAEARQDFDIAKKLLEEAQAAEASMRREKNLSESRRDSMLRNLADARELEKQERLLKIAKYHVAKSDLDRENATLAVATTQREKLEAELALRLQKVPTLERNVDICSESWAEFERKKAHNAKDRERLIRAHQEASYAAKLAATELAEFQTHATLRATKRVLADQEIIAADRAKLSERRGVVADQAQRLRATIKNLKTHGIPVEVHNAAEALQKAGLSFTPAWQYLPKDNDRIYEEGMGTARFGIILANTEDLDNAVTILKDHQFPGPISTLSPSEYKARAENCWTGHADTYETQLGVHVLTGVAPILNPRLLDDQRNALQKQLAQLEDEQRAIDEALAEKAAAADALTQELERAKRRDDLATRQNQWNEAEAHYQELEREYHPRMAFFDELDSHALQAQIALATARSELEDARNRITHIKDELQALPKGANFSLTERVQETWAACAPFYEELKAEGLSPTAHEATIRTLKSRLTTPPPTDEEVELLLASIRRLTAELDRQEAFVKEKRSIYTETERNHQNLVIRMQTTIEDAFKRVSRDVEELAKKVGFDARLTLNRSQEQWHLEYDVAFHKDAHGRPLFKPIKNSADSTGEGAKAALVFCLAMSDPAMQAWYFLDEPAMNFSPKNVRAMFQVLSHTNAQVILTSTRDQDYGEEVDIWQHALGELTNGTAPPPSRNRYNNRGASHELPQARL